MGRRVRIIRCTLFASCCGVGFRFRRPTRDLRTLVPPYVNNPSEFTHELKFPPVRVVFLFYGNLGRVQELDSLRACLQILYDGFLTRRDQRNLSEIDGSGDPSYIKRRLGFDSKTGS